MGKFVKAIGGLWKLVAGAAALFGAWFLYQRVKSKRSQQVHHAHLAAEAWDLDHTANINIEKAREHRRRAQLAAEKAQEIRRAAERRLSKAKEAGYEKAGKSLEQRFDAF